MSAVHVQLMKHQHEGVAFLVEKRSGLLAFEQGLGKTLVAIEAFRHVRAEGKAQRLLVLCPNSLKRNWVAELSRFASDMDAEIVEGTPRHRRRQFADSDASVLITSYETARTEVTSLLALVARKPTALVLDESHAAKNWRSQTSTAARHVAPHCAFRWLLSGTPVTNSAADLFTQLEIVAPGEHRLGSMESFVEGAKVDPLAAQEKAAPLVLRRTKEDCLDLPEKTFVDVHVELPPWQRRLYVEMRDEMVCAIRSMSGEEYRASAPTALAKLTRLIQIASNPALVFPKQAATPGKFEALDGMIGDVLAIASRKVIIWSNYVDSIESLVIRYKAFGAVALYGKTPVESRQDIATRFQTDSATRVLVANPAAAGTGFTFTTASYSIYETLSWRYDFYAQSQDRNHRIGQDKPVTYIRLVAVDTIEEAIIEALDRKTNLARTLLGDSGHAPSVAELTQEQMCNLLMRNELPNG